MDEDLSFSALDDLLDRALALDGAAREDFLATLGPGQREALTALLKKTSLDAFGRVEAAVGLTLGRQASPTNFSAENTGDWQLGQEIGSGGTGQVFYAERRETREGADTFVQRAAIKILWSHQVESQFQQRFLRERRILASIDHRGLARFLDGGLLKDGRPWFAMEYVDGRDIIEHTRELPIRERLLLFLEVADTIDHAHQRLIVHRDIKPQNILVDALGNPRILDFGIAGLLGELESTELTRAQGTPLTLQYASPEQITGGVVAVASDVYQLGLLFYEMLAGQKPYLVSDRSLRESIEQICSHEPPAPSRHNPALEKDLDAIAFKALRKASTERYASAAAMADDVRRFAEGRPITARRQSNWYVWYCFLRRNVFASAIAIAAVASLALATAFSLNQASQAREEAERSRATQEILAEVFEQADPFGEGGANITLADALVRAKPLIEARVSEDPRLAWEVNRTLAGIFTNLDLLELEKEAFRAAWDAAKALDGDNEPERLFAIAGLGNILVRTDPTEAIEFFAEHLPDSPSSKRGAEEWLSAKYAETSALLRLRENARAARGASDMARVAREFGVDAPRTRGRIDQLLAGAARRAGDTAGADRHWASAVENMRRADAPLALAVTLSNYALHYGMTGRYETSAAAFEESVDIFRNHATDNTSHANVLRLYAGLLFRMRRPEDAQTALDEALAILDPKEQGYAYFIAQLSRANMAFASEDVTTAFDAITEGLDVGVPAFGRDSEVTLRMLPVFARLLLFAGRTGDAARLVGIGDERFCTAEATLAGEVERISSELADAPDTESARRSLSRGIDAVTGEGKLGAAEVDAALADYYAHRHVFLDPLDRFRHLAALNELSREPNVVIQSELSRLQFLKGKTERMLEGGEQGVRLQRVLGAVGLGPEGLCQDF